MWAPGCPQRPAPARHPRGPLSARPQPPPPAGPSGPARPGLLLPGMLCPGMLRCCRPLPAKKPPPPPAGLFLLMGRAGRGVRGAEPLAGTRRHRHRAPAAPGPGTAPPGPAPHLRPCSRTPGPIPAPPAPLRIPGPTPAPPPRSCSSRPGVCGSPEVLDTRSARIGIKSCPRCPQTRMLLLLLRDTGVAAPKKGKKATSRALPQSKRFHKFLAVLGLWMVIAQRGIS